MASDKMTCPICAGQITKEIRIGHLNKGEQAHGYLYKAFCESCQIMVERNIFGKQDTGWFSSSVDKKNIIGELLDEELVQIEKMLIKYPRLLIQWREFIAQKRETDVVCRFKEKDLPYTGLTIKRGDYLIGRFWVFRNL
ncbi:MAG: hypothetical protein H7Y59_10510 [Anaerolineales bacterium]|nr:hypothetical protein [Anaerolineales bacterium]